MDIGGLSGRSCVPGLCQAPIWQRGPLASCAAACMSQRVTPFEDGAVATGLSPCLTLGLGTRKIEQRQSIQVGRDVTEFRS